MYVIYDPDNRLPDNTRKQSMLEISKKQMIMRELLQSKELSRIKKLIKELEYYQLSIGCAGTGFSLVDACICIEYKEYIFQIEGDKIYMMDDYPHDYLGLRVYNKNE